MTNPQPPAAMPSGPLAVRSTTSSSSCTDDPLIAVVALANRWSRVPRKLHSADHTRPSGANATPPRMPPGSRFPVVAYRSWVKALASDAGVKEWPVPGPGTAASHVVHATMTPTATPSPMRRLLFASIFNTRLLFAFTTGGRPMAAGVLYRLFLGCTR